MSKDPRTEKTELEPHAAGSASADPHVAPERKPYERPELRRRGALPTVTTAFGGSFTP